MPSELTFYTNPFSRGRTIRWLLEELGIEYETKIVEFRTGTTSPEFRAVNPMGKVPTIVHKDLVITESAAICVYLAEEFPQSGLAPTPQERADYYRWLFFCAGPLEAAVYDQMIPHTPSEQQQSASGYGSLERVMDALDVHLGTHSYFAGNRFTAADVYCGCQLFWGRKFNQTIRERTAIREYVDRITDRPTWNRAQDIDGRVPDEDDK